MPHRLTKETKALLNSSENNQLAADVCDALKISINSLRSATVRNTVGLITLPVLRIIADYSGKNPDELIEEYNEDTEQLAEQSS